MPREARTELGVEDAVSELIKWLPENSAGLKRTAVPDELRQTLVSVAPGRTDVVETWLRHSAEPIRRSTKRLSGADRALVARAPGMLAEELRPERSRS